MHASPQSGDGNYELEQNFFYKQCFLCKELILVLINHMSCYSSIVYMFVSFWNIERIMNKNISFDMLNIIFGDCCHSFCFLLVLHLLF